MKNLVSINQFQKFQLEKPIYIVGGEDDNGGLIQRPIGDGRPGSTRFRD